MAEQRVCAVIPAAGRGTRIGLGVPKITIELADGVTVWHVLHERLRRWADHVHVVVSPDGEPLFRALAAADLATGDVSMSVQAQPDGMGDAIFGASQHWDRYDAVVVVWGDQAGLSADTVRRVVTAHRDAVVEPGGHGGGLTVPLVPMPEPYVEYEVSGEPPRLLRVRQSREGDECRPGGLSDVGVFCLSTDGLTEAWLGYLGGAVSGASTGEVNFLPFLPYLSGDRGWRLTVVPVIDVGEARGINTPDDLDAARRALRR
jgi:bifunctional UDP-N-acetylglucosamine pyrophosphorylase/glucosamine-1-phosphate N-acetyltransferase